MRFLLVVLVAFSAAASAFGQQPAQSAEAPKKLAVAIASNDPLNLFFEDELASGTKAVTLSVTATNNSGGPLNIAYSWSLVDYQDRVLKRYRFRRNNLQDKETDKWFVNFHLDPDLKGKGLFRFKLRTTAGGEEGDWELAFAVIPKPAPGLRENSMFGIACSPDDKAFEAMR
ncbi:MAG: hypothetical protein ACP5R4_02580, partial [Armatimonadota bacterium]